MQEVELNTAVARQSLPAKLHNGFERGGGTKPSLREVITSCRLAAGGKSLTLGSSVGPNAEQRRRGQN